jgi:glycine hydroxymethyltransferase
MTAPGTGAAAGGGVAAGAAVGLLDAALAALDRHEQQAARSLNLIPSENCMSPLARLALLSDAGNRYFFNDTAEQGWAFPAGREASWIETQVTVPLLKALTGAGFVNIRPLSGLHAMTLVLAALGGGPAATVVSLAPEVGGHYATASLAARLGLRPVLVGGAGPHRVDLDRLHAVVDTERPALVYLDQCHALFPLDIPAVARAVRAACPSTRIHVDVSHWLGLVLGGAVANPLAEGADSIGGSTHKTFPGPQKAVFATNDPLLADQVRQAQQVMVSSHHLAGACALGIALAEFLACDGAGYAHAVLAAARGLGAELAARGLPPEAAADGYSGGHQLWVRTSPAGVPATLAAERLDRAGIRVNVLTDLPGMHGEPALRLGLAEATYLGLRPRELPLVAELVTDAVHARRPTTVLARQVAALRRSLTSPYQQPLTGQPAAQARRILTRVFPVVCGDPAPHLAAQVGSGRSPRTPRRRS